MKRWLCLAFVIAAIVLSGCDNSSGSSDLPVDTKKWVTTDGYYQFYTNDAQLFNYTFWYPLANNDTTAVFNSFTGITKKISGSPDYGFGFLFCNTGDNDFYYVLINTQGYYLVGKHSASGWSTIIDWKASASIKKGMDVENVVTVVRTVNTGDFAISFNGVATASFKDTSLTADAFAPAVCIGKAGEEDFPNNPVDVRFKFTAPDILPSAVSAKMFQAATGNFSVSPGFAADIRP